MSRVIRHTLAAISAVAAALLLAACGQRESNADRAARDGILLQSIGDTEPAVDPHLASQLGERTILTAVYEGLVAPDPQTLAPRPAVAEGWDIAPDGLTYTFHLRADARWSNGDPVTAADFAGSFHRALSPALRASNAEIMFVLRGARDFAGGRTADFSTVGIRVIDPLTLELTLEAPQPQFLAMLTHWVWLPVHLPSIRAAGAGDDRTNPWARSAACVGNGPFQVSEIRTGQRMVLVSNPHYWNRDAIPLKGLTLLRFTDKGSEERAFRGGLVHLTDALPIAKLESYRATQPAVLHVTPSYATYIYRINTTRPPLDDPRVRRALSLAVNRAVLAERVLHGAYQPATSFVPPGPAGYEAPPLARSDTDAARAELAAAGFPNGAGLRAIEILFNKSEDHQLIAEAIQAMWRTELGLNITLASQENAVALENRRTLNYDVVRGSWFADYADPVSFLEIFTSDNANNQTGWSHAGYDSLLARSALAGDPTERVALLAAAEKILLEEAPVIPIYTYSTIRLVDPRVTGWFDNALDQHPYTGIGIGIAFDR